MTPQDDDAVLDRIERQMLAEALAEFDAWERKQK
jgi:hypothetical protein